MKRFKRDLLFLTMSQAIYCFNCDRAILKQDSLRIVSDGIKYVCKSTADLPICKEIQQQKRDERDRIAGVGRYYVEPDHRLTPFYLEYSAYCEDNWENFVLLQAKWRDGCQHYHDNVRDLVFVRNHKKQWIKCRAYDGPEHDIPAYNKTGNWGENPVVTPKLELNNIDRFAEMDDDSNYDSDYDDLEPPTM